MDAHFNRFELEGYARNVADAFLNGGADLNDSITKLAETNGFTPHHIDRVAQNANIFVNAELVNRARSTGDDPRVTFPMAKSAEIASRLNVDGAKSAELRKEAEVVDLFTVRKQAADHGAVLDATVGAMAPDPYADHAVSLDHVKLAEAFLVSGDGAEGLAKNADAASLSLACQTLETLEHQALTDHNLAKHAMDEAEAEIRSEIHDQILYGSAPATLRDVIKHAEVSDLVRDFVDGLVTKVAAKLSAREGASAFADGAVVNADHPMLKSAARVMDVVHGAARAHRGLNKISTAHKSAHTHYSRAVREGR